MKKTKTGRILALLLTFVMVLGMLPATAMAADTSDYTLVLENGKVYKDSSTGTALTSSEMSALGISASGANYTFTNVNFTTSKDTAVSVQDSNATITLVGTNTIAVGDYSSDNYGITAANMTLSGSGSLSVTSGVASVGCSTGISATTLTIDGCDVSAYSKGGSSAYWHKAISASTLNVKNGTLTALSAEGAQNFDTGIFLYNDLSIENSTVITEKLFFPSGGTPTLTPGADAKLFRSDDLSAWTQVTTIPTPQAGGYYPGTSGGKYLKFTAGEAVTPETPINHTVTVQNDGNGTASASPASAAAGTEITLSATPKSGYVFDSWQVISGGVTITDGKFVMPDGNVTVKAIFKLEPVIITYYDLWINGVQVTSENMSGTNWNFTPASGSNPDTITLTGTGDMVFNTLHEGYAIYSTMGGELAIVLDGADSYTIDGIFNAKLSADNKIESIYALTVSGAGTQTPDLTINKVGSTFTALNIKKVNDLTITGDHIYQLTTSMDIEVSGDVVISNESGYISLNTAAIKGKSIKIDGDHNGELINGTTTLEATDGDITMNNNSGYLVNGPLTIKNTKKVTLTGNYTDQLAASMDIKATGEVKIVNNGTGNISGDTLSVKTQNHSLSFGADPEANIEVSYPDADILVSENADGEGKAVWEGTVPSAYKYLEIIPVNLYTVTVYGSHAAVSGAGKYKAGDTVTINSGIRSGYTFNGWTSSAVTITNDNSNTASFIMPDKNVEVTANWTKDADPEPTKYTVTVNDSHAAITGEGSYAEGDTVMIYAGTRSGYTFDRWTSKDVIISKPYSKTASFTMPGKNVKVTANWTKISSKPAPDDPIEDDEDYYTLSFNTNGGSGIISIVRAEGTTISLASCKTTREGYNFTGWYADAALTRKVSSVKLTRNTIVYAGWEKKTSPAPVNPFTDVSESDWFYDDVMFAFENDLMKGTSSSKFSPYAGTTRGMIVAILYRLEGEPFEFASCPFTDVAIGSYYENAIIWAAANGIVMGYGDGKFGPDDQITREQLAAIFYRYADYKGYDLSVGENTNILSYDDAFDISDYAYTPLQWACGEGLISGYDDGCLYPAKNASRAQVAAILHRFIKEFVK